MKNNNNSPSPEDPRFKQLLVELKKAVGSNYPQTFVIRTINGRVIIMKASTVPKMIDKGG